MKNNNENIKCKKCGSEKQKEVITGGIIQTVYYNENDAIVREETTFTPGDEHSKYFCTDCDEPVED